MENPWAVVVMCNLFIYLFIYYIIDRLRRNLIKIKIDNKFNNDEQDQKYKILIQIDNQLCFLFLCLFQ